MSISRPAFFALLALATLGCAASSPQTRADADARKPTPEALAADTPKATPAGATFTAPGGWSLYTRESWVVLDPPEGDSHIALVDVRAADADEAVASAWKLYKPEMKRPVRVTLERPAREGWEQRRIYTYETSPNERAVVQAIAQRKGAAWTVALIDGTEPAFEKRDAPANLILESLRPAGYERESFAGRIGRSNRILAEDDGTGNDRSVN